MRIVLALPLAFLAGVGALLAARWDRIPDPFPVHWGLAGTPDRWAERSALAAVGPGLAGGAGILLMLALRGGLPALAARRGRGREAVRVGEGALLGASYAWAAVLGAAAARPLLGDGPWGVLVSAGMGFLFVPLLVALATLRRGR